MHGKGKVSSYLSRSPRVFSKENFVSLMAWFIPSVLVKCYLGIYVFGMGALVIKSLRLVIYITI